MFPAERCFEKPAGLPALLLGHLHALGVSVLFGMGSSLDYADSPSVISGYGAGGLGLPERDYYFRTDAKSVEQRKQSVDHVKKDLHARQDCGGRCAEGRRGRPDPLNTPAQGFADHDRGARPAKPQPSH